SPAHLLRLGDSPSTWPRVLSPARPGRGFASSPVRHRPRRHASRPDGEGVPLRCAAPGSEPAPPATQAPMHSGSGRRPSPTALCYTGRAVARAHHTCSASSPDPPAQRSWLRMHAFDLAIYVLAAALTLAAYLRDPSLPSVGFRTGGQLLLDVLPRLIGALIMTGMLQVLIAPE